MGDKDNIVPGEVPSFGAIFMSNIGTKKECFRQKLFGLPSAMCNFVLQVKRGTILFLFEFERRQLFGVFRATSDGEINIEPNAFKSTGKRFPAQVRFTQVWNCSPLAEHEFQDAIRDNYFSGKKFNFGLSKDQVGKLMMLFLTKRIPKKHPARSFWREGDMQMGKHGRFSDDRKNLVRDRKGFVSKVDGHGLYILSEFVGDEVEADDHMYLNGNVVEKVNNFNYDRGQGNRTVMVERTRKDGEDGFVTNYATESDDFGDCGTRQAMLGKHLDHSLGGLGRVADTGFRFMGDVNDEHGMQNNLGEIRGIANKDTFFEMEKIKGEHNIELGNRQIFTEPHGKCFGKIGVASTDAKFLMDSIANKNEHFMDDNRIQDEYTVTEGFSQNVLEHHLGGPCNRGSRTSNGSRFFSHELVESERRTLSEHPPSKLKGKTDVGVKPDYDEDFSFGPRTLTERFPSKLRGTTDVGIKPDYDEEQLRHSFGFNNTGKAYDSGLPYSTPRDTTMITMSIPYDPEVPDVQLRPSSKEILTSMSMSESLPYHPRNKGSVPYLTDDPGYAFSSKSIHSCHETRDTSTVEGNWVFKTAARESSRGPLFPDCASLSSTRVETAEKIRKGHRSNAFSSSMSQLSAYDNRYRAEPSTKYVHSNGETSHTSKKFFSSDAGLCPCKVDPIQHEIFFCQPRVNKHLDDAGKRVSVFARLTSAPEALRHEQEINIDEKHDLDVSVNKVMKMLEKVVSSPIKRTGKSISGFKQEDDNKKHTVTASKIVDYELPKVKIEPDANLAYEVMEGGSILQETRLVDFKRRRKGNKSLGDKFKGSSAGTAECKRPAGTTASEGLAGTVSDGGFMEMFCKRRKLVRPVFVRNESTAEDVSPDNNTHMQPTSHENRPSKFERNSTKAVESFENVDTSMKSVQTPAGNQKSATEGEASSQVEGNGNAASDALIKGKNGREQPREKGAIDAMTPQEPSPKDNHMMCGWIEW